MTLSLIKTIAASAVFAVTGSVANAATVASIETEGLYSIVTDGQSGGIGLEGTFNAFLDFGFDPTVTQDFLLEIDLKAEGLPTIDEELLIEDVTGEELIFGALGLLLSLPTPLLDALENVVTEVLDGDADQSEIVPGLFFGFDYHSLIPTSDSLSGGYTALLSDGQLGPLLFIDDEGDYAASIVLSTVAPVPLPATLPMLAFAGFGLFAAGRRRAS